MPTYEVIITPDAEADLIEIKDYIAYTLLVPEIALHYIQSIRKVIEKLSYMAKTFALVQKEPWHSRGVRKVKAKNFLIYYRIDESAQRVYVLNVIYARRDQLQALKNMKTKTKN